VTEELFKAMRQSIIDGDAEEAERLAKRALDQGLDPLQAIDKGFIPGVDHVGEQFSCGSAFLPELVMAGDAMKAAIQVLEAAMAAKGTRRQIAGRVVLATVEGDIHDIGKSLVGIMMFIGGFEVHDLGTNVPMGKVIEKAREVHADIVGLSALLTTTMVRQRDFVEVLDDMGLKGKVRVMVGGAPVTRSWADEIGADGYSEDAVGAVEVAKALLRKEG
jgi:corrinoid protein of di/trimethylamine methyltransferase